MLNALNLKEPYTSIYVYSRRMPTSERDNRQQSGLAVQRSNPIHRQASNPV